MAVVHTICSNDQHKHRSTTGSGFTYCVGAIFYLLQTQSITAISYTEAKTELLAAISCANIVL